jgi:hypothetical protein
MDPFHEKEAIEEQNAKWGARKNPKANIKKKNHPWYFTTESAKRRVDLISGFDPYKDDLPRD